MPVLNCIINFEFLFSGKTSTIVALVRLLVQMNISVLLTSYTHSAIDNILLKLKDFVEFVRIGPKYRIHPEVLEFSFENLTQDFSSADRFNKFMKEKVLSLLLAKIYDFRIKIPLLCIKCYF